MALTELQTKQLAHIEEGLAHFNSTNLGIVGNRCMYSAGCWIGRHLSKELAEELDVSTSDKQPSSVCPENLFDKIPDTLKELGRAFLGELQDFHDFRDHWSPTGMSDYGKEVMQGIKFKYGLLQ